MPSVRKVTFPAWTRFRLFNALLPCFTHVSQGNLIICLSVIVPFVIGRLLDQRTRYDKG